MCLRKRGGRRRGRKWRGHRRRIGLVSDRGRSVRMLLHSRPDGGGGVLAVAKAKREVSANCEEVNEEWINDKNTKLKPLPLIRA